MMRRRGFTLVELLVVIAIIGLLIALLLPSIQAARESGRRTRCQSNLRQVALAMHLHHDNKNHFPAARLSSNPKYGHMVGLLPYIEQGNLANMFDATAPGGFADPVNQPVANAPLEIVRCPSNPMPEPIKMRLASSTGTAYGEFITLTGSTTDPNDPSILTGQGNDYWVNHAINASAYALVSSSGTTPTPILKGTYPTMGQVTDGLSYTTMILEHAGYDLHYVAGVGMPMPPDDLTLDQPGAWGTWLGWCAFTLQTYPNFTPETYPRNLSNIPAGTDCVINCNNSQGVFGFHPNGANIAMGDASVRLFSTKTSAAALLFQATRDGGETLGE